MATKLSSVGKVPAATLTPSGRSSTRLAGTEARFTPSRTDDSESNDSSTPLSSVSSPALASLPFAPSPRKIPPLTVGAFMETLECCCLITLRFESDSGASLALCGGFSVYAMRKQLSSAFSHPLLATLDESTRFEHLAQSIELDLLSGAGVAVSGLRVKQDLFGAKDLKDPVTSLWLELDLIGSINARKERVIESTLSGWFERVFPASYVVLPSSRPIPLGTEDDMVALRAGWRAEAVVRGFSVSPLRESMLPTPAPK